MVCVPPDASNVSRISFLTPLSSLRRADRGGLRFPINLARAVARGGEHEVSVATIDEVSAESVEVLEDEVRLQRLPFAPGRPARERLSWGVIDAVRQADLLHVDRIFSRASEVAVLAGALTGKPICASDFGSTPPQLGSPLDVLSHVDVGITPSAGGVERLASARRVEVIPAAVDTDFFTPGPPVGWRDPVAVLLGSDARSGALQRALPAGIDILVCGPQLPDEDARELFRRAQVVIERPSGPIDQPGTSLLALAAMACGAAVVCGLESLLSEYIVPGKTGFLSGDDRDLRQRLAQLTSDQDLTREIGRRARQEAVARFSLEAVGAQLSAVYDELLMGASLGAGP